MKRLLVCVLIGAVALILSACGGASDSEGDTAEASGDDPIRVGIAFAKSGLGAGFDGAGATSFQLGVDDINANGGLLGRQIEVVTADTQSKVEESKRAGERLVGQDIDLLVAPCDYDLGSPAALVAQTEGIVSFSLCSRSPKWGVQGIGNLSFSPGMIGSAEGYIAAEFAYEDMGWKNAIILNDGSLSAMKDTCLGFEQRYEQLGGEIVDSLSFQGGSDTVAVDSQIAKIRRAAPDVVMLCSYPPGGPSVLRQMRSAGVDVPIVSNSSMDGDFWLEAVPNLSDFYFVTPASIFGDDDRAEVNEFTERFTEAHGSEPISALNYEGYIVSQLWAAAVEEAGTTDGAEVAAVLENSDLSTLLGGVSFNPEEHIRITGEQAIIKIEDGKHTFVKLDEPDDKPPLFITSDD